MLQNRLTALASHQCAPGSQSRHRCCMWVGFVVFNSFLLCSEGFFLWLPWFSPLLKNQPFQIPIQLRMHVHLWTSSQEILSASWIYHFLFLEKLQEKNRGVGGNRGGSRGRVQGVRTPTWDDLQFSNTTGILQKKNYVVYWCWSRARDECTPS